MKDEIECPNCHYKISISNVIFDEIRTDLEKELRDKNQEEKEQTEKEYKDKIGDLERKIREFNDPSYYQKIIEPEVSKITQQLREHYEPIIQQYEILNKRLNDNLIDLQNKTSMRQPELLGEIKEINLENKLKNNFPNDIISSVPRGKSGPDIIHKIRHRDGYCGTILWESKNVDSWSNEWLEKLKKEQVKNESDMCIIVSKVLPKGVENFELIDNILVCNHNCSLQIANIIRNFLIMYSNNKTISLDKETKAEALYAYISEKGFRLKFVEILRSYNILREDIKRELTYVQNKAKKRLKAIDYLESVAFEICGELEDKLEIEIKEIASPKVEGLLQEKTDKF